ncbi:MAG: UvrD-helicase domain-containing protein [Phycisphaerales bacterium]|nr:UvrD-helicase domain-containing protein [Phycisphaerales bacterium]
MSPSAATSTTPLRHQRILASAGSGKTYQLASRYLALVAAGAPVGSILASTFTRLAAGEIRDRVLLRLVEAAGDEDARRALARTLGRADLARAEVLDLLRQLTDETHRLRIRTMDGFFASIVHAFALELGIPPGAGIVDEPEAIALRQEAVHALLAAHPGPELVELLRLLTQGTSERGVTGVIDRTVVGLYELYREAPADAWDWLPLQPELSTDACTAALTRLATVETPTKLADAVRLDLDRARSGQWETFVSQGPAAKLVNGVTTYSRTAIPDELVAAYRPLLAHARAVLLNRLRDQTRATRDLLERFDRQYERVKAERRRLTFADLTMALVNGPVHTLEEIAYRLDANLQHLLLDEFQDTSVPQWRALAPIARELVADETRARTFFCVGDVKQSIYGWRDACPELLEELPSLLLGAAGAEAIEDRRLHRSYRSAPVVMDLVNRVFGDLPSNAALAEHPVAAERFGLAFETHETERTELTGCVELRTVEDAPKPKRVATRLRAAATLVATLHRADPSASVAVLTRTNAAVTHLLYELGPTRQDVPAAGRGGGPLTDTPAVNALLDLLRLADHPADTIAAFNVARGPLGASLGFTDAGDHLTRHSLARQVRAQLLADGYAATLAGWTKRVAAACDPRQHRRLLQLVELAAAYEPTLRPDEFVTLVERQPVPDVAPAPVQVMTIHQAKGLEFDVVVLPELDEDLTRRAVVVTDRVGIDGPVTRVCRWVNRGLRTLAPELEPLFVRHSVRDVREALALLYVAITRARRGVFMLIDPPSPSARKKKAPVSATAAGVLRAALTDGSVPDPDAVLFALGDRTALTGDRGSGSGPVPAPAASPRPVVPQPITLQPGVPAVRGATAAPASALGAEGSRRRWQRQGDETQRDRGRALHRLFEQITWIEDFDADDAALHEIARQAAPRRDRAWVSAIVDDFRTALDREAVRTTLGRGGVEPGRVQVWRERRFARLVEAGGERRVQEGSIDRLVAGLDADGRVVRARVIDFKTDQIDAAAATTHADRYRPQLETYRAVAAQLLGIDDAAIDIELLFVTPGTLVALSAGPAVDLPLWGGA